MARLTIVFALALMLLGVICYAAGEPGHRSHTALIPSFTGIAILVSGLIALNPNLRMHAMHVAVLFGLLGFIGAVVSIIKRKPSGIALVDMGGMAVLTGLFVVLCVRSFIQARRARSQ